MVLLLSLVLPATRASAAGAQGTVKDVNNAGVSGAFVMLFDNSANVVGYAITAADGSFTFLDYTPPNPPLSDAVVNAVDGFVMVQPNGTIGPLPDQLGIYQHQPRAYLKPPNTSVDILLPNVASFVIKGYKQDGSMMRWGDFVSTGPGSEGAQYMYLTNLDEEMQPAVIYPTYDGWARQSPQNGERQYGLPSLVVDSRNSGRYSISVMYWNVKNYGKLCLKADNAGAGFELPSQGGSLVVDLNAELARTAIADLQRRLSFYETYITDEDIPALISAVGAVPNVDDRLHDALQLRDRLELKAAQNSIDVVRKGTLRVTARDVNMVPVKDCTVTIDQTAHDFLFGANGGAPYDQQLPVWNKVKEAGFELAPVLPAWGFTEDPNPPYTYMGKPAIEATFGITRLREMGFKVKFTGSVWMQGSMSILPPRTQGMSWQDIRTKNLANQDCLLNDFSNDPIIWEAMNEPATTNTVGMPRTEMAQFLNTSALDIKAANGAMNTLVNSPPEFDFGLRYQSYTLAPNGGNDNQTLNAYSTTYSDFLKQARTTLGNLDSIDTIGLQFYPGCHVSAMYGSGEAPAFTPSWLVDTAERYNTLFGKPVHITEMSCPSSYDAGTWHSGYWRQQWNEATQADYAESVYTMMFANPAVHSVLWWDMSDTGAFVQDGGLIKADYSGKPSYDRIKGLIDSWTTKDLQGTTDTSGQSTLSGFGGDYDVTVVAPDGKTISTTAHINEQQQNSIVVDGFNPMPTTTGISPDHKTAGDPQFTLTVNGTEFVAGSTVRWNGSNRTTSFVSDTQLTATIPASDITANGTASVTVMNPGNLESNEQTFTIDPVPVPTTTGISPDRKAAGDSGFTLTVNGTNFVPASVVNWNGSARTTTYVNPTRLTASIPGSDIATAGTASVTVFNPTPGGGTSNAQTFTVDAKQDTGDFYFAEGTCRPGFDPFFCIQNPGGTPASVTLTYMKGDGTTATDTVSVPPSSRATVSPKNRLGTGNDAAHDFSTKITSDQPVIAERPMYFNYTGGQNLNWNGGHDVVGATSASDTFYFAEGTCRPGFDPFFCIQNPGGTPASVTLTYITVSVPPSSRATVSPKNRLGTGNDAAHDFSTKITSDQPIIAERPMYFNYTGGQNLNWNGGHNVVGFVPSQ